MEEKLGRSDTVVSTRTRLPPLTRILLSGEMSTTPPRRLRLVEKLDRWAANEGSRFLFLATFTVVHVMVFAFGFLNYHLKDTLDHARATFGATYSIARAAALVLHFRCNWLPSGFGPQKNTPASAGAWILRIPLKTASQFGRPKFVGVRRPVIVSVSVLASLIMMFSASSGLISAVRYYRQRQRPACEASHPKEACRVNLNRTVHVLSLDSHKERSKPLKRAVVSADPKEINLPQPGSSLRIAHAIPYALKYGCERCHTDPGSN